MRKNVLPVAVGIASSLLALGGVVSWKVISEKKSKKTALINSLDDHITMEDDGPTIDLRCYLSDLGGKVLDENHQETDCSSVHVYEVSFGKWNIVIGSTSSFETGVRGSTVYRTLLQVVKPESDSRPYCVYYDDWSPEDSDVVADRGSCLMLPLEALEDIEALILSHNLEKNIVCPFEGTNIHYQEWADREGFKEKCCS